MARMGRPTYAVVSRILECVVMRQVPETWHNRWAVAFSIAFMFFFAVMGGLARGVLERFQPEFRNALLPEAPVSYASLSVITLLFCVGMVGNVGLVLYPLRQRLGAASLVLVAVVCVVLLWVGASHGFTVLRLFRGAHSVSGGDGE
jgi:hypothetical protein